MNADLHRPRWPGRLLAGWAALALPIPAFGQATAPVRPASPTATRPSAAPPAERPPEYAQPLDIPGNLLRPRKPQATVLPSVPADAPGEETSEARSGGEIADVKPTERLLPEGYVLARRPARFGRDESWWAIAIGEVPGLPVAPSLRVLPNRRLMLLERVLAAGKPDDTYLVTGRVTEFLGRNYVFLEEVTLPSDRGPVPAPPEATKAPEPPATQPTRPPTASEVIEQLMRDAPVRAPTPTSAPANTATEPGTGTAESGERVLPEGTIVPEFPARLVKLDLWWTLARESQGSRPAGPPYYVLPNRLLEVMVAASAGGSRSMVFLVSGELTEYRGANYLLVRKVLTRRELGNLR